MSPHQPTGRFLAIVLTIAAACLLAVTRPATAEHLCDPSWQDCRAELLTLIKNEKQHLDVAFWFMTDSTLASAIIARKNAGVPVRVLMDKDANIAHPGNAPILNQLKTGGVPMRERTTAAILHWKCMIFAGQGVVEFSGANYGTDEFIVVTPYVNYDDEAIYYTDDLAVVTSFMRKFDDWWIDTTSYANYANVSGTLTRSYPLYTLDPDMNFPPQQAYEPRAVTAYNAETQKIDVIMFRITDKRHSNAMISAVARGVPVRLISEPEEYRNPDRLWDSWNVDLMYMNGIQIRFRAHSGLTHQKSVILHSEARVIFGSSNWTSPSNNYQQEHNYFTTKGWIFQWFVDNFERKWNNLTGNKETKTFKPLPPDAPIYKRPASNGATGISTSLTLKWDGGPFAHIYDVYFGTTNPPPLYAPNLPLGPDDPTKSTPQYQTYTLPTLQSGKTYYWKIVSKTMANMTASGPVWSFTTQ